MQLVMTRVVMWLNDEPTKVNYREGDKRPLVDDLIPSISADTAELVSAERSRTARAKTPDTLRAILVYAEKVVARAKALGLQ
jgi:hypothetical protein